MRVVLKFQTDTFQSEVPLEERGSVVVGRTNKSSHMVPDELLSGAHCRIVLQSSKLEVVDLDSKNGTYLNGLRVAHSELFIGDELRIGNTKVIIVAEKMDASSVSALTFPGANRDRQSHGLKLDFTGARMINQGLVGPSTFESKPTTSANKELEVRKKVHSKILLSKQEIKLRNKSRSSLSSTLDIIFTFSAIALPLFLVNLLALLYPSLFPKKRLLITVASVAASVVFYYIMNFKLLKFTLGEKISGIEKLYKEQED